ncbi:MAG: mycobacterial-type methylenetetrahydrofolate reductase [Mycobacterium sp.]
MSLNTVALELVPPNVERGAQYAVEEAVKVRTLSKEAGVDIGHIMIPGMIDEDDDRPIEMKPKMDVLEYWSLIRPELPASRGLCTQVTSFLDESALRGRLTELNGANFDGIAFVGVPRTLSDGEGGGVAPTDALSIFDTLVPNRGVILIPTRDGEQGRFNFKCNQGATYGMTQLLYSDAIVGFLTEFAATTEHRPEILLSFGFVPKLESKIGLINWLIQDPGNAAVAAEQEFVGRLAPLDPDAKRREMLDLYKRVVDGVGGLGFPLSVHFEAAYGPSKPAFDTFAAMLDYWAPASSGSSAG